MIVKHDKKGWEIISHYAHGLLCGKIAQALKIEYRPAHWIDILTGIIEHDDHLLDFEEQNYLTENGSPQDFTMEGGSNKEALEHCQRVHANAMQKSQLVALMVGRHLDFLYGSLAKEYKAMHEFLKQIKGLRKTQRKLYGLTVNDEDGLYDLMLFCDRLSLIICQEETPEVGRKLEINCTIDNETYFISKLKENTLSVKPWPFEKEKFVMEFEYRTLIQPAFKDNLDLKSALDDASISIRTCTFKKA